MSTDTSARHGFPFLSAGQAQKELAHNEALALIDAAANLAVEAAGIVTPPVSPGEGDCWIVGADASGAWAGQDGAIACWTGSGWRFLPSLEGMQAWVASDQLWAIRHDGAWRVGDLRGSALSIGGDQVVGPRLSAIRAPTAGITIDTEARNAITAIIERLAAHGLIAP